MFTYDMQYGGDPHDKYDQKGETNYEDFMSAFENFPWFDELDKANANPGNCSPTLSVKNVQDETDFWVSMAGTRDSYGYLVGNVYFKLKKGFLGFGKAKTIKWVEIYLTEDKQLVKGFYKLYFDKNNDKLLAGLRALEKFGEMEVHDK